MKTIIAAFTGKPNFLFLTDSVGAATTAFILYLIRKNFIEYFHMPATVLSSLMKIAAVFCVYSILCFLFVKSNMVTFIKIIAVANLLYCVLTLAVLVIYWPVIRSIAAYYFIAEIVVICGLVYVELSVAKAIGKR